MVRVIEISPSPNPEFGARVIRYDGNCFQKVLAAVEKVVGQQTLEFEMGERKWEEVGVSIVGREILEAELNDIEEG